MDLAAKWKRTTSNLIGSFRIFSIREDRYKLPRNNQEGTFYILESSDWVNVIPLTDSGEVILIRQFRFGTEEVTLEIPGGLVEPAHTPLQAAQNELLEETGFQPEQWEYLGFVHPNPAFLNNRCHSFLARGVKKVAETRLEESEEIETLSVPYQEIKGLIAAGQIRHSLVLCAFHLYALQGQGPTF
jgi:8-oxo-dGTP pyrophosphatase MutT (NUDIX family)